MLFQHTISGPPQSGKTTTVINVIRQYQTDGISAVCIVQNQVYKEYKQKRFGVPCLTIREALENGLSGYRVIVIDDADYFQKGTVEGVVSMLSVEGRFVTLILVRHTK